MNASIRRFAVGVLLVGLLLTALNGCGPIGSIANGVVGPRGTLRLAGQPPETLDPALAQDTVSSGYLLQIYSGLVRLDTGLNIQPDIATSWDIGDGGKTYTFHLHDSARFQDGRAITADDFKFSLERALDPATRSPTAATYLGDIVGASDRLAGKVGSVGGVVVLDPRTLRITIDAPKTYFLAKLTYATAFVVDANNVGSGPSWSSHPNGSGPFVLQSFTPNDKIVLTRNARYYGPTPTLAEIDYYLGPASRVGLYRQGNLDVVGLSVGDIPRATDPENPLHTQYSETPLLSVWYVGLNVKQKPFDDPKVRLAFAYATNKKALTSGEFHGTRSIANGIIPPGMAGYDSSFGGIQFDPQKAKATLAESSYGGPAALPKMTLSVSPGLATLASGMATMYHDTLGVDISIVVLQDAFFQDVSQGKTQMYILGWVADYPDPQDFLEILFGGSSDGNHTGYDNPAVNQLLTEAQNESDVSRRTQLYANAERLIVADAPAIPLYFDSSSNLIQPRVKGLTITPIGIVSFAGVTVGA